jgi:hypothetical protein
MKALIPRAQYGRKFDFRLHYTRLDQSGDGASAIVCTFVMARNFKNM